MPENNPFFSTALGLLGAQTTRVAEEPERLTSFGTALQGISAGASVGAAAGSLAGPIGTGIGAAVGTAVGAIGSIGSIFKS